MEATKTAERNSSRTPSKNAPSRSVVIAVVIVLLIVAIAGIVLAGRRTAVPAQGTAAAVPDQPVPVAVPGLTPQAVTAPTANANEVVFEPGSDKLPRSASESIAKFSESVRSVGGQVRLSVRFVTGPNKARDIELGRARTAAVRHALQSNGLKAETMQVELVEMPVGSIPEREANRVELSLR